jgi:hypothetical protein
MWVTDCGEIAFVGKFDVHTVKLVGFQINKKAIYN